MEVPDGTAIGARVAAMNAGVGAYQGHAEAVSQAVRVDRQLEPNHDATPLFLARYKEYKRRLDSMQDPGDQMSRLKQG